MTLTFGKKTLSVYITLFMLRYTIQKLSPLYKSSGLRRQMTDLLLGRQTNGMESNQELLMLTLVNRCHALGHSSFDTYVCFVKIYFWLDLSFGRMLGKPAWPLKRNSSTNAFERRSARKRPRSKSKVVLKCVQILKVGPYRSTKISVNLSFSISQWLVSLFELQLLALEIPSPTVS